MSAFAAGGWNACERGKELGDRLALQLAWLNAQKAMRRFVGEQYVPVGVQRENRGRAARNQELELLFSLAAKFDSFSISADC